MYGEIVSGWERDGDALKMEVEIPANTSATLHIPGSAEDILINGAEIANSGIEFETVDGNMVGVTGSGHYTIQTKLD